MFRDPVSGDPVSLDPAVPPSLPLAGPAAGPAPRRAWVEQIMGMPVSIHVRGPGARVRTIEGCVDRAVAQAFADLRRVDAVFSTYRPDSQLSRLRRGEITADDCDAEVREVIDLCDQARARTGGWFDAYLPDRGTPDPDGSDPGGVRRFDPTGLVKGWAIENVAQALSAACEGHDVLVVAGGDIAVRCRRADTPDWQLGIEDPADTSRLLARVGLRTGGMATSGTAARGAHILDPHTGEAVTRGGSVTVIGPRLLWADVYATAAFAMGPAAPDFLAGLADHRSFVVAPDGTTTTVTGR